MPSKVSQYLSTKLLEQEPINLKFSHFYYPTPLKHNAGVLDSVVEQGVCPSKIKVVIAERSCVVTIWTFANVGVILVLVSLIAELFKAPRRT
mgnify:FL=1